MPPKKTSPLKFALPSLVLLLLLTSCTPHTQVSPTPDNPPTQAIDPTEPIPATPTQTPAEVWLIHGENPDENVRESISTWLTPRAAEAGLTFVEKDEYLPSEVPSKLSAVIFLSGTAEISNLAANMPDTQFVAITNEVLSPSGNLSVIRTGRNHAVFLAGYLATLVAPDFRSGALFIDGNAGSSEGQDSFLNGGRYFCGRCSPVFAPIVSFPQVGLVSPEADAAAWQSAFETLHLNRIEMLYLPAEGLLPDFLTYLADKNVGILSNGTPPPGFDSMWVATVTTDPVGALDSLWPQILAGSGGQTIQASLELTHVNQANLSIGRRQMAELIIPDLTSGIIEPLTLP